MRLFLLPVILWIIVNSGIDFYIFRLISRRLQGHRWVKWVYAASAVMALAVAIVAISLPMRGGDDEVLRAVNWLLFIYLTVYIPKYIFLIFDFLSRIPVIFKRHRSKLTGRVGIVLTTAVFVAFWWGALINRYRIDVKEVTVVINGLPESFDGYRIAQFSDFHVGTYGTDTTFVAKVVETINDLKPDAIVFTGDIVNRHTSELPPFTAPLSRLRSPSGVKAILGNHDYGDYYNWSSDTEKAENMEELYRLFKKMGWKLLLNETDWLVKGNDSIALIGVENIGDPPFPVYGSLAKAYPGIGDAQTKILLSHNPAHWVDSISGKDNVNVALTLSGHTHAMQMTLGGLSPASFRYKTWGGMYIDLEQRHKLYVNIGLGTVGLPMRIGATPEITLITLKAE